MDTALGEDVSFSADKLAYRWWNWRSIHFVNCARWIVLRGKESWRSWENSNRFWLQVNSEVKRANSGFAFKH